MRTLARRAARLYGDRLFHLLIVTGALALTGYTISVLGVRNLFNPTVWWQAMAVWFAAWFIAHRYRRLKWPAYLVALPFFAVLLFFAFDYIMSLTPHWYSTIFGVYCFAGLFQGGIAAIEAEIVREQLCSNRDDAVNVIVLDDVTPRYAKASAALNDCRTSLRTALNVLAEKGSWRRGMC